MPVRSVIRTAVPAGAAALTVLAMFTSPAASAQSAVNYVALGDSYSSGVGAGNYIGASGACEQSTDAFPALWAAAANPATYASMACSGATSGNVITTQVPALSTSTTLVSVTAGGDDVGFLSVMETCALIFFYPTPCINAVDSADTVITSDLPSNLDNMLAAIKAAAPNATVVVLGYPEFFDLTVDGCPIMLPASRTAIDQGIDLIDNVLQTAAQKYGDVYVDARTAFAGHEVCDSDSWVNKLDWANTGISYHPTAEGQADGYLPAFSAAVKAATATAATRRAATRAAASHRTAAKPKKG